MSDWWETPYIVFCAYLGQHTGNKLLNKSGVGGEWGKCVCVCVCGSGGGGGVKKKRKQTERNRANIQINKLKGELSVLSVPPEQ